MGIGGILQALVAAPSLIAQRGKLHQNLALVCLGAATVAIYPLAFYSSMRLSGVAVGTVISIASAPIASAILERAIDGHRLAPRWFIAVALCVAGSVMVCVARVGSEPEAGAAMLTGAALGLIAGTTYALYTWVLQRLMQREVPRGVAMGAVFGLGGVALIPVLIAAGSPVLASGSAAGVAVYMALIPMFAGYLLFGLGIARVRASTATTLTLSEPAVAAALAVWIVAERMAAMGWLGMAFIGIGLAVLTIAARPAWAHAPRFLTSSRSLPDVAPN